MEGRFRQALGLARGANAATKPTGKADLRARAADALPIIVFSVVYFAAAVAALGTLHAFLVLNGRRVLLVGLGLSLYIASWVVAGIRGWVDGNTISLANLWIITLTVVLGTAYVLRRSIADRIFTARGVILVLGIWVGFALMSLWFNPDPIDGFDAWLAFFLFALLPLAAALLAPWSFSRLRHR